MFLDEAIIEVRSGRGGDGSASFRREKHVPRGGPDGGDGGDGGDIIIAADPHLNTLIRFQHEVKFRAEDGAAGGTNKRFGKRGRSVRLEVPVGTVVKDSQTGSVIADLAAEDDEVVICKGGRGGKGNLHFTSSVRQAPTFAEKGEPAESCKLKLELKLLADVGLIGLPNAGKSTLISTLSAARPKIADYPFTTIVPHLGIVRTETGSFVMADLPGLIEGASAGKGLGHQFLRHTERTRVIVHLVECLPADGSDPAANLNLIEHELALYSPELVDKPRIVALSKVDLLHGDMNGILSSLRGENGREAFPVSAVTGEGLENLVRRIEDLLMSHPRARPAKVAILEPVPADQGVRFEVARSADGFRVTGPAVQRMVSMTDLANDEAVRYLHKRLTRMGVIRAIRESGARDGDTVHIGAVSFVFSDDA